MKNESSKFSIDLKMRVSHDGFGISEAYIVYDALGDYAERMLPYLLKYHSEALENDEYDDTLHALSVIGSVRSLQGELFMKLLDKAEDNAFPDSELNSERNRQREAEQLKKFRELFKIAIPQKGGEGHD